MKRTKDTRESAQSSSDPRGWKVLHQSIGICQLNLRNRSLLGWVDLRIKTTRPNIKEPHQDSVLGSEVNE